MEFGVKSGSPEKQRSACIVVGVFEPRRLSAVAEQLDRVSDGYISSLLRRGGEAIHDIHVRVTIDRDMNVVDVAASSDATPFMGTCENIIPDYRKIIGLNLFDGFRQAIKALYGDIHGCTHLNELLMAMPTAAYQTFAGETPQKEDDKKPFHLDRCHALSTDSEVVRRYYPRWYRGQTPE